ncbi:HepT-like ribonuclease domain-containing protein [Pseudomonas fungipugnans]|uniref:HepT-like ribonuclease domain-containing protein n=1 Tax=Pseudomonas fungipugnans TaxID=3024217 RepID=UPI003D718676
MDRYPEFATLHAQVPWRAMRNRIAHGYFDINLEVVWDTVQAALPELLKVLPADQAGLHLPDSRCNPLVQGITGAV